MKRRQHLQRMEQHADATKLTSLMRLARARKQSGWRYQQKTVEGWLQEAAHLVKIQKGYKLQEISGPFEKIGIGAIPVLIEALRSPEWYIRFCAAFLLGVFGPDALTAVPALVRTLNDPKARVRREVLKSLILIKHLPTFVLPSLLRALQDKDAEVAALATRAIAFLGPAAENALPLLLKGLAHPSGLHRSGAAFALGKIGIAQPAIVQALSENLVADNENRPALTRALARLAPEVLGQMLPTFNQSFNQTLLSLVPLEDEIAPLFPALLKLYRQYMDDPVLLIVLRYAGHHAAPAVPLLLERYKEKIAASEPYALVYGSTRKNADATNILHALRGILIDIALQEERQRGNDLQADLLRLIEFVRYRRPSRRQRHLLASLEGHTLEEHELLRKRVELGDLALKQLELAAFLGYRPAMRALQQKLPRHWDALTLQEFLNWGDTLANYGTEVCVRIGHALVRSVLRFWDSEYWDDLAPRYAVIALEDWLSAPERVPRSYVKSQGEFIPTQWCSPSSFAAGHAIKHAVSLVNSPQGIGNVLFSTLQAWMSVGGIIPVYGDSSPDVPIHQKSAIIHIRTTIREMLIPWLLQRHDLVRDTLTSLVLLQEP